MLYLQVALLLLQCWQHSASFYMSIPHCYCSNGAPARSLASPLSLVCCLLLGAAPLVAGMGLRSVSRISGLCVLSFIAPLECSCFVSPKGTLSPLVTLMTQDTLLLASGTSSQLTPIHEGCGVHWGMVFFFFCRRAKRLDLEIMQ